MSEPETKYRITLEEQREDGTWALYSKETLRPDTEPVECVGWLLIAISARKDTGFTSRLIGTHISPQEIAVGLQQEKGVKWAAIKAAREARRGWLRRLLFGG